MGSNPQLSKLILTLWNYFKGLRTIKVILEYVKLHPKAKNLEKQIFLQVFCEHYPAIVEGVLSTCSNSPVNENQILKGNEIKQGSLKSNFQTSYSYEDWENGRENLRV